MITVCALMRNEENVIGQMLRSVTETLGDSLAGVVLADTGSTDDTIVVARAAYPDAVIVGHDWQDFSTNRNRLLDLAYEQGSDWLLMLDPDMTLEGELPALDGLGYEVEIVGVAGASFTNPRLLSTSHEWHYEGVVHEALANYPGLPRLEGLRIRHHGSTDHTQDGRFAQDREMLQSTLNTRNIFYLAQTERDLGNTARAIELYDLRVSLGGWDEEVYYARYQSGMLRQSVEGLLGAWEGRPQRGEALYYLLGLLRGREAYRTAHALSTIGATLTVPTDVLFVEPWIYDWGLTFEHSIACYWVGDYQTCADLSEQIAQRTDVPWEFTQQAKRNRNYAKQHLPSTFIAQDRVTDPVAILVPVLGRPHKVEPLLRNIAETTPEPHRVMFAVNESDAATIAELDRFGVEYLTVSESESTYARKINRMFTETTEPYLFLAADDYVFYPGWLTAALTTMREVDGVVAVDDFCNPLGTCCLVSRRYIIEDGGSVDNPDCLHPSYHHNFTDMELFNTAKSRGRYAMCLDSMVEHQHHVIGKSQHDATYALGDSTYALDEALYRSREPLWSTA